MTNPADSINAFAFEAQNNAGEPISGTIDAPSVDEASRRLHDMQLRVIEVDPVHRPPRAKPLRGDDFQAFNTQLAHLTSAGLPLEKSLQLIAEDMRSGRLAASVRQVAAELENGRSLPEAFEKHAAQFPPLYAQLLKAGIRTGNLPAILLNLGRHLNLVTRLRAILWRAVSYPLMVLVSLFLVLAFLGLYVFPQFKSVFANFIKMRVGYGWSSETLSLPAITRFVMSVSDFVVAWWPVWVPILVVILIGVPLVWAILRRRTYGQKILEAIVFPLPLIGPALKRNLLARWCDGLRLGIEAGLDLPAAIALAGDVVGSPGMRRDGDRLIGVLQAGQPLESAEPGRLLPPTVYATLSLATDNGDLPAALETLGRMYQEQAELKMSAIPVVLTPVLIVLVAVLIGIVVAGMFAPIISFFHAV